MIADNNIMKIYSARLYDLTNYKCSSKITNLSRNFPEFFSCRISQRRIEVVTQTQNLCSVNKMRVEIARISFGNSEIIL